jgi:hypothetical protein
MEGIQDPHGRTRKAERLKADIADDIHRADETIWQDRRR